MKPQAGGGFFSFRAGLEQSLALLRIFIYFFVIFFCTYIQTKGGITPPLGQYIYDLQIVPGMKRKDKKNIKYIQSKIMNLDHLAYAMPSPHFCLPLTGGKG